VRKGESFAFETTLSGRGYAHLIPRWRQSGYEVKLFFLQLSSPEIAIARVAARVAQGGHGVPEEVIRRRFFAGQRNCDQIYKLLVDSWIVYDSSGEVPLIVETGGIS
jgi:predicted ABC-type ATPase